MCSLYTNRKRDKESGMKQKTDFCCFFFFKQEQAFEVVITVFRLQCEFDFVVNRIFYVELFIVYEMDCLINVECTV